MPPTVKLLRPLQRAIRSGHPWIYREALAPFSHRPGTAVQIIDKAGRSLAVGLVDEGPIAVRVFSTTPKARIDRKLFAARIADALLLRERVIPPDTNAYRLIHGEGDRLPGLVCDRYGRFAVVKFDGVALAEHLDDLRDELSRQLTSLGIEGALLRRSRRQGGGKVELLFGHAPNSVVQVRECGATLRVDLNHGQKTGMFLDHRPYRSRARQIASGMRVLNLYGYTGGFSVAAALGGATHVTTVDVARPALELASLAFSDNNLRSDQHEAVAEDVPSFLDAALAAGRQYDLVIADPPNFAPSDKSVPAALESYEKLHSACMSLLPDGGMYLAASCSSHIRMGDFLGSLRAGASRARRVVTVLEQGGAPADHPRLLAFPESDYLKVVLCKIARL